MNTKTVFILCIGLVEYCCTTNTSIENKWKWKQTFLQVFFVKRTEQPPGKKSPAEISMYVGMEGWHKTEVDSRSITLGNYIVQLFSLPIWNTGRESLWSWSLLLQHTRDHFMSCAVPALHFSISSFNSLLLNKELILFI